MWGKAAFFKHLGNELPVWIEKGWVSRTDADAMLAHYDAGKDNVSLVSAAFGVLGVMLLLSGVITFFAANWSEMAKLTKLVILFGSLLLVYGLAIKPFSHENYPRMWATMLLLATGIFGANIMLIAQIYHIDSHYPNGVLLWSLGALLLAWLVPAQAVMVMAIVLAALWTGMETIGFDHANFAFLVFFAVAVPRIAMQGWRIAAHIAGLALLLWSVFAYVESELPQLLGTQLMFVSFVTLFIAGLLLQHWPQTARWSALVRRYSAVGALAYFYRLTGPHLHSGWGSWGGEQYRVAFDGKGTLLVVAALVVLAAFAVWHYVITRNSGRLGFLDWARWLLAACVALIVMTWFTTGHVGGLAAIAFNVFYFAVLVWLVAAGLHMNDRALVNLAFLFFAITLVTRYFDTFWTLMNRSFFFMAGGVLLLVLGFLLERQRRNLTARIEKQKVASAGGAA